MKKYPVPKKTASSSSSASSQIPQSDLVSEMPDAQYLAAAQPIQTQKDSSTSSNRQEKGTATKCDEGSGEETCRWM